jgi:hypothetical protein
VFSNSATIGPMHACNQNEDSGFVISTAYPAVGASPDGIFAHDYCYLAVVGIKHPYNIQKQEHRYLKNTLLKLKANNLKGTISTNYYKIQTQNGVSRMEIVYFVVWTEKNCHIETMMSGIKMSVS